MFVHMTRPFDKLNGPLTLLYLLTLCCRFVACAESQVVVGNCTDLLVCAAANTTTFQTVSKLIPETCIVSVANGGDLVDRFVEGACNVMGASAVTEERVRFQNYTGEYEIGSNRFSKEPRSLVTSQDDSLWSDFVFWVVQAIFAAEERGITKATGSEMPESKLFGPVYVDMLRNAIRAVGNVGEIYERNIGATIPRAALNRLNDGGPQIYPILGF